MKVGIIIWLVTTFFYLLRVGVIVDKSLKLRGRDFLISWALAWFVFAWIPAVVVYAGWRWL